MPDVADELARLRAEVEAYKQRETTELRATVAALIVERDHYRAEAMRIEGVGRKIAQEYERQINELKTRLAVFTHVDVSRPSRNLPPGRG